MIKGIVFDKDGTLIDYESFWVPVAEGAVKELLDNEGFSDKRAEVLDAIGAYKGINGVLCYGTYGDIASAINSVIGKDCYKGERVADIFSKSLNLAKVSPTCPNIKEVFSKLREKGLKLAVVTSDNLAITEFCLKEIGIIDFFDVIYADDGVHPSKPNPYYMQKFCADFSLEPNEVLMVGDTMTDMNFAKNSGAVSLAVGKYAPELLSSVADNIAKDISFVLEILQKYNR